VPRVVKAKSGGAVTALSHNEKIYPVLLLDWLSGDVLAHSAPLHFKQLATLLAQLGRAMRGFSHAAILERDLIWDVMRADALRPRCHLLGKAWEKRAGQLLDQFMAETVPQLRKLRAQMIHGDVHPFNVLLKDNNISGIIDFGDMVYAPLIVDLANTIADCLHGCDDAVEVFGALLEAYHAVTPLEREEAMLLVSVVKARLLTSTVITRLRIEGGAASTETLEELAKFCLESLDAVCLQEDAIISRCLEITGHKLRPLMTDVLERRVQAMGPKPLLFYSKPLHMLKGDGVWLHADDGRAYLDCYNNVAHIGHAHPAVADAVSRQLRILNTNTRYLTDEAIQYAEELKATLDASLDTVIFVNSGSEANDVAWRMAQVFTGNRGALCMEFAYHGVTAAIDALSPSNYPEGKWNFPHVGLLEAPDVYRGRFGADQSDVGEAFAALADAPIADLQRQGLGVAFAIMDSAFMSNGILDAPQGYVHGVVQRVRGAGGLFVADEVQSGFGRMGSHMWGHQRHGVVPDFVTIGKPAGNGYPVGVIITRAEILQRFVAETGPFFSTFGGGNAACAAGLAVLDVMRREGLMTNAHATGDYFRRKLQGLMQRHEIIGDVRGAGLAIGIELVRDRRSKTPARAETKRVLDLMRDEGVLIGSDGKLGNVLKLRPPLVFKAEHVDVLVGALDRVLKGL
jgi:4-aminobutyrate aminotransferase-like enzyme/Ser/Thr protein kinase RdoA (MazF antagonist)